ncbi:MAG: tRNA (adenosine(37)-N6)-dimethylallyltransferase MiaA [Bacteroidales bacterium]|jgi:tRNA dimethylallyltransferase|nr:tRNA (adenosine(37)-N6)-dimethylallyltransferase MiaA [Bacteroidales bacterium]NLM92563.1 tRNA (adenosine(37)-N6)-dimethylallyltransferase MiaA [Bacteroidales bacterium]
MKKEARILRASTKKNSDKTLVVVTGPTGVGKTGLSIDLAGHLQTEIVSADARQFYRELHIGTAAPAAFELSRVRHHFVGHLSIHDDYNVSRYEQEALEVIASLFRTRDYVVVTGGSGLYIDALCKGFDDLPPAEPRVRRQVEQVYRQGGLDSLRLWLKQIDPEFYLQVDPANPNRMKRAIEVFLQTGYKFSALRTNTPRNRPFRMKKIVLDRPREVLFDRINRRVDAMVEEGLIEEALHFFRFRHLNALNTVGYKEIFAWLSGACSLNHAITSIKTNTRRYAKRQITWFKRDLEARWMKPEEMVAILDFVLEEDLGAAQAGLA